MTTIILDLESTNNGVFIKVDGEVYDFIKYADYNEFSMRTGAIIDGVYNQGGS